MKKVKAKKRFGQHFLKDEIIAQDIVDSLSFFQNYKTILEIGPGMGILTKYLLDKENIDFFVCELDFESVEFLKQNFPKLSNNIIQGDFLKLNLQNLFEEPFGIIGNFPYNISSQIIFKTIENHKIIPELVGMFQKEVAQRICAKPGNKTYGIISVLSQAFYETEYLFTVNENVFSPPPKVKSAVIRLKRKEKELNCEIPKLFQVVKIAFNQRRKMLRNSLKSILEIPEHLAQKRPEQLSLDDFVELANLV